MPRRCHESIVRSSEPEKEATIELLGAAALPMRTLRTSGTLKTLRERYFAPKSKGEARSERERQVIH
jgi:hypothetical protein